MVDIAERSSQYASEKMEELFSRAIAQAYADGYRDGYKVCQEEINREQLNNIEGLVDLGLPSGTLWSPAYIKEGSNTNYLPYVKASELVLPTEEQVNELFKNGRWYGKYSSSRLSFYGANCCGISGEEMNINCYGYKENGKNVGAPNYGGGNAFFWIFDDDDGEEKKAVRISDVKDGIPIFEIVKLFSGLKLPVLIVGKK